jgi:hypothetical protein
MGWTLPFYPEIVLGNELVSRKHLQNSDIFILGEHKSIRFWKNGSGFEPAGLDYLIKTRKEYYVRRQRERTLKRSDRVAVLGRGIHRLRYEEAGCSSFRPEDQGRVARDPPRIVGER